MVFSSGLFLFFFLPALLTIYFLVVNRYKNIVLLAASILFYAWGEPKNILLMLASIVMNYLFGILMEKCRNARRIVLILSVTFNLGLLFVFKYLNFSIEIINRLMNKSIAIRDIALPIGISFFTFQIMSYVIDVYRGRERAQKNILNLALYISLFPQLIAGPIVRYADIRGQIEAREISVEKVYGGFRRFAIGFSKKILIADQLSRLADTVFQQWTGRTALSVHWIGIIAYALQIYFDFSGYSDMAIGLGKIFGFDFPENFNYPYISQSIQEFWRRWHMSLSSWFRDYVYIPLGGSRKGTLRTYRNLLIVFFLTGLWHGASFNFIVWGLIYAVFLILERMGLGKLLAKLPGILRHVYSLGIVLIAWVFFRADTLTNAVTYIRHMFVPSRTGLFNLNYVMNPEYWFFIIVGLYFSVPHEKILNIVKSKKAGAIALDAGVIAAFVIAICYMVGSGYSPFLYFRF